jgi:hypothetical protein
MNYLSYQGFPSRAEKADVKTHGAIGPLTHMFHDIFLKYEIAAAIWFYNNYYCDLQPESRDIGARIYDCSLDQCSATGVSLHTGVPS